MLTCGANVLVYAKNTIFLLYHFAPEIVFIGNIIFSTKRSNNKYFLKLIFKIVFHFFE